MVSKELKKLSRRELIDIIYQLKKNEQQTQEQLAALEEALQDKRIRLSVAGSIAEAATDITQVFATAQQTADLYLHEIACMKADAEKECAKMIEDAKQTAEHIFLSTDKQHDNMDQLANADYKPLQQEVQAWEKIIIQELLVGAEND